MATGDSSVHQQLSHGGFGWNEGRQTHSPPDPRESRTLREKDHTWHAGHDTEDGGRYVEQSGAHAVCHRQRDDDSGETTQPEERPSIEPWRRQATTLSAFSSRLKAHPFPNHFLYSLSGSIWTAFTDFGLVLDLVSTGVCLLQFILLIYCFLDHVCLIKLTTLSLQSTLNSRIISYRIILIF